MIITCYNLSISDMFIFDIHISFFVYVIFVLLEDQGLPEEVF